LNFKWWQMWQVYVDWESDEESKDPAGPHPGPVDNAPLCKEGFDGVLRFGLVSMSLAESAGLVLT